jgi:spectinomycin phosphotransferase
VDLSGWVRDDFGLTLESVVEVHHGADAAARLWRATDATGQRYAVKLSGGGSVGGLAVTHQLARAGILGIPGPLPTQAGGLYSLRPGGRLSVVPWVADEQAVNGDMTAARWTAFGALLAGVHATVVGGDLAGALPAEAHENVALRPLVERLDAAVHERDPLARELAALWRRYDRLVWTLLDRIDQVGQDLRAKEQPAVICHGDPHLANLLLDGERIWLIDWDDAVLAPPERDLMLLLGGMGRFGPAGPRERSWFFDGYGPVTLDATRLTYYRCVRTLEDFVDRALLAVDDAHANSTERAAALDIARLVLGPEGMARLAAQPL